MSDPLIDKTFTALSNPTRRAIHVQLGKSGAEDAGLPLGMLAEVTDMSLQAGLDHLERTLAVSITA